MRYLLCAFGVAWFVSGIFVMETGASGQTRVTKNSGDTLTKTCKLSLSDHSDFCQTYIAGVTDMIAVSQVVIYNNSSPQRSVCIPMNVSNKELAEVYISWMDDNKNQLDKEAAYTVYEAFQNRFGCEK